MSLKILLDDQIKKLFAENPSLKDANKNEFEMAVASFANLQHLHGIDFDDLIDGIMGDGGDEGIDHCYIFCNGFLVKDDAITLNEESHIKIKFFQTKKESGFSTDGFRKLKEGIEQIFNLELSSAELKKLGANADFIEKAELIRSLLRKARTKEANFSCEVIYATVYVDNKISEKIHHLANELNKNEMGIPFSFYYWGAQDLLNLTKRNKEKIELPFISQPLEIKDRDIETSGYSGFVSGNDLIKSLIDESGNFKSHLTEGNVRYFLGEDTNINSSIIETAKDAKKSEVFWAMNNGLTIIGDSISALGNNQYKVTNPQIVNGCQTVHCLYQAFDALATLPNSLKVFVKLINTSNIDIQTDIISATNSQNPVKAASLKANDEIQRNIELHLLKNETYYERRENFYKRQGHTGNKVISLLKMAQIIHTVVNKESIIALNDTTGLFETDGKYKALFNNSADFDIYTFSTILYQKIWSLKNSDIRTNDYPSETRDLISKGGLTLLHCMSSLILSNAEYKSGAVAEKMPLLGRFPIAAPARNNEFSKRKNSAFQILNDDEKLKATYQRAKELILKAAHNYEMDTGKPKLSIYKNRNFDREFLIPVLTEAVEND